MKFYVVSPFSGSMKKLRERLGPSWNVYLWKIFTLGGARTFKSKVLLILEEIINFIRLVFDPGMYGKDRAIICEGCQFSVLLFGKWLQFIQAPKPIYILTFFIHAPYNSKSLLKILGFLLDQKVGLTAFSASDRDYFKGIGPAVDVRFSPYAAEIHLKTDLSQVKQGDYVFAGGYTNRDYNFLIRCAEKIPRQQFTIVCSHLNKITMTVPANVEILKDIHPDKFYELLAACKVNVIPLKSNVGASGQSVAVAAMQFAKPTLYPDFGIVSQYFTDGVSGLMYGPGDDDSFVSILNSVIEDPVRRAEIGNAAQQSWKRDFKQERFEDDIFEHLKEFFGVRV